MGNKKAKTGGVVETVGFVQAFKTIDCPTTANVGGDISDSDEKQGRIDVSECVKIHISSESFERRVIFADDETDLSTNIVGESSRLYKANEEIILDVAAQPEKYLYVSTTESSNQTDGIRATLYDV